MSQLAKFLPHNGQEHDNDLRALVQSKMGMGQGNPTQWVMDAVHEAYQRGFGVGFAAGAAGRQMAKGSPDPVAAAAEQAFGRVMAEKDKPALPFVDMEP